MPLLLLIVFMVVLSFKTLRHVGSNYTDPQVKAWQLGLWLFLLATAVQYQTYSTLYITHIWTAVGLLYGLVQPPTPTPPSKKRKP